MSPSTRRVAVTGLVFLVVLAGCLGGTGPGAQKQLPSQPVELNESSVESYVLEYERIHLSNRLSKRYGNDSYGVGCCTAPKEVDSLLERSGTYYVRVQYPYHYRADGGEADAVSKALYVVAESTTERISLSGRTISVDEPYSASNQSGNSTPPKIYVVNAAESEREVSLNLTHLGRDERAFERTLTLESNRSVEVSQIAYRKGEYRLTVASEDAVSRHEFTIDDSDPGTVFVLFTEDGPVVSQLQHNSSEPA